MKKTLKYKLLSLLSLTTAVHAEELKPNVVVLMADDIGLGDIGYYHSQRTGKAPVAPTPNIDKLISEGMRFSDAHSAASLSAPTRFSMLTGNYSYRNKSPWGVWTPEGNSQIEPQFTTVARIAKAGGYTTAFFGKWGLGSVWTTRKHEYEKIEQGAMHFGFDYALELPQGIQSEPYMFFENQNWMKLKPNSVITAVNGEQAKTFDPEEKEGRRDGMGDSNWDPMLAGPILASKAVEYIKNQASNKSKQPFYLYYCSQAVHVPHTPAIEINGVKIAGTTPGNHGDMIRELDVQVGMIVEALKKSGAYNNTLFVFTSDNGGLNKDKTMTAAGHDSSNGLMGKKGSISEGGHRVPFIAVWPGKIKANSESDEMIVGMDMVATIAALANQAIDRKQMKDAANLLPYFTGKPAERAHQYIINRSDNGPSYAIRMGEWKLILKSDGDKKYKRTYDGTPEPVKPIALFNLKENLGEKESQNLINSAKHAQRVKDMFAKYNELRSTGDPTVK